MSIDVQRLEIQQAQVERLRHHISKLNQQLAEARFLDILVKLEVETIRTVGRSDQTFVTAQYSLLLL